VKLIRRDVKRFEKESASTYTEKLPVEEVHKILINGKLHSTVSITPGQEKEFLAGYLFAEGVIDSASLIEKIETEGETFSVKISSQYSVKTRSNPNFSMDLRFQQRDIENALRSTLDTNLYKETGGTHSSALCREDRILYCAVDVGRHNTLDKIIGSALLSDIDLEKCYIVTSGRITGSTVEKVARAGVPLVASKGAVTSLAAELAEKLKITLIGFVRENRMSIYTEAHRLITN
jgi:FdhD protein